MAQDIRQLHSFGMPKTPGLCVDEGEQPPGSFVVLKNFDVIDGGNKLRRRADKKVVDQNISSRYAACRSIYELRKDSGTKYAIVDVDTVSGGESNITAPAVKPTLADAGASGNTSSIGSVVFTPPAGAEELADMDGSMNATGVAAAYVIVVEIDGMTEATNGTLVDTFKWSKDNGSSWEATGVEIPTVKTSTSFGIGDLYADYGYQKLLDCGGGAYAQISFNHNVGHTVGGKWTLTGGTGFGDYRWYAAYTPSETYAKDDLTTGGTYNGDATRQFVVKTTVDDTTDKFQWSTDGGSTWNGTDTSMTGAAQTLAYGVTVTFTATSGHALGSKWTFTCTPAAAPAVGKHYVKYTYQVLDDDNNIDEETNPSPSENISIADGHEITFTPTASADSDVTNIGIYMTPVADEDTYYFVESVDNTATPTTIDISDADLVLGRELIEGRSQTEGFTRIIMAENTTTGAEIDLDTSWTTVKSDLTTPDTQPSYATAMDRAYRCDGSNDNIVITDTSAPRNNGVVSPTVAAVLSDEQGGSIARSPDSDHKYRVYYTYVIKDGDVTVAESGPSPYAEIELQGSAIGVTVVGSDESDVTHIRIYRNIYGSYDYFYEADEIINATLTVTLIDDDVSISADDIVGDTTLKFYEKPPKATYCVWCKNHMFYANLPDVENGSSIIRPSRIENPEQATQDDDIYFDLLDGMEITGLAVLNDIVYAFKQNKILYISPFSPYQREKVANGKGCIDGATLQNVPDLNALIWLSPEGIVLWDGGSAFRNISVNRVNSILNDFIDNAASWASRYQAKDQTYHIIGYYRDDTTYEITDHIHLVYHFRTNAWSQYEYLDDDGNVQYEVSLGTLTDANSRETMISGYIRDIDGNILGLWQNNYEPDPTSYPHDTEADHVVQWGFGDSSGNVYLIYDTSIVKVSATDTKTTLVEDADVITAMGGDSWDSYDATVLDATWDPTNEVMYLAVFGDASKTVGDVYTEAWEHKILKCTTGGTLSSIESAGYVGFDLYAVETETFDEPFGYDEINTNKNRVTITGHGLTGEQEEDGEYYIYLRFIAYNNESPGRLPDLINGTIYKWWIVDENTLECVDGEFSSIIDDDVTYQMTLDPEASYYIQGHRLKQTYRRKLVVDVNGTDTEYESEWMSSTAAVNSWINTQKVAEQKVLGLYYNHMSLCSDGGNDALYYTATDDSTAVYGGVFRTKLYRVSGASGASPSSGVLCELASGKTMVNMDDRDVSYPGGYLSYGGDGRSVIAYHDGYVYFVVDSDAGLYGDENYYLHDIITPYAARINTTTGMYEELVELEHDGETTKGTDAFSFVVDTNGRFFYHYDGTLRVANTASGTWSDAFAGTTDEQDETVRWACGDGGVYESMLLHTYPPYLDIEGRLLIWTGETVEECTIYRQLLTEDTNNFEDKMFGSNAGSCTEGYTCSSGALCSNSNGFIFFHRNEYTID